MSENNELEKLKNQFRSYYDINSKGIEPFPFCAEFHSHNSHYFLTKKAPIGEAESHEYVFFFQEENLNKIILEKLINKAWELGLKKVNPTENHRNSDIILIILAKGITEESKKFIKKCKLYKSYNFLFKGWSAFKLAVVNLKTKEVNTNKRGKDLKKFLNKRFL